MPFSIESRTATGAETVNETTGTTTQPTKLTPFEADLQRKTHAWEKFHDARLRRDTCLCGDPRSTHQPGYGCHRCRGLDLDQYTDCRRFRRMNDQQWAKWCGVELPKRPKRSRR